MKDETGTIVSPIYHDIYGFMQEHKLFGAWERTTAQHLQSISTHLKGRDDISILYCGTATKKNPQDVQQLMTSIGMPSTITTMDLARKPLHDLDKEVYRPVQADSASLPYADKSFDYITTDFLLSKMNLPTTIATIAEWGRTLRDGGLITMTTGVKNSQVNAFDRLYDKLTQPLYGINFIPLEVLEQIFYASGLEVRFEKAQFDQKPFMYRYPDEFLIFVEAQHARQEHQMAVERARILLRTAMFIHGATHSEEHLRPLGIEDIIHGLMSEHFLDLTDEQGRVFGFIRLRELTKNWTEVGSLYIDLAHRHRPEHYGTNLLLQAVAAAQKRTKNAIIFSDNPTVTKTLEKVGARKTQLIPSEIVLPLIKNRRKGEQTTVDFIRNIFISRGTKSIYTLSLP